MPVYRVVPKDGFADSKPLRVVSAETPGQVRAHLARGYSIESMTADEALDLVHIQGVPLEMARNVPDPVLPNSETVYSHKDGCTADKHTPITGPGCRCLELDR